MIRLTGSKRLCWASGCFDRGNLCPARKRRLLTSRIAAGLRISANASSRSWLPSRLLLLRRAADLGNRNMGLTSPRISFSWDNSGAVLGFPGEERSAATFGNEDLASLDWGRFRL